jgi:hypothetical protein
LASDPSSQMSSSGRIRGDGPVRGRRTQCPDEASRGAPRLQITTETIESSMAIMTEDKKCSLECRVSPSLVTSSTHHPASAAERIAILLTSARSARRSTRPIGSEQDVGQSNRVFPCAQFRASPAGLSRSPTPRRTGDRTPRKVGNQGRQNERGNQSGEKQQCTRVARLYLE